MQVDVLTPKAGFAPPCGVSIGEGLEKAESHLQSCLGEGKERPSQTEAL